MNKDIFNSNDLFENNHVWPIDCKFINSIPEDYQVNKDELSEIENPFILLHRSLDLLSKLTEQEIDKTVSIGENVIISGPVIIRKNVVVDNNVCIKGPVIIDENTFVGVNSLIRNSIIGENTEIGANVDVGRSIIGANCRCSGHYLKDSILSDWVWIAGGVTVSNLRADEKELFEQDNLSIENILKAGTAIGRNSTIMSGCNIMPGVMIGKFCKVFPGVTLYNSIEDGTIIRVKQNLEIINGAGRFMNRN